MYGEPDNHWVSTLRSTTGKRLWRSIECNLRYSLRSGLRINGDTCINGVLYYGAYVGRSCMIVCFDFSSEKFMSIKLHEGIPHGILINYKGNLGVLVKDGHQIVLWVLDEDAGNHIWCKTISAPLRNYLYFVGWTTGAGEIVLSPHRGTNPFYIVYYQGRP
ncbi:unnamed protein product [Microthlaspi erraticum]|uniref:F-box associated beta-propeller type 3 domain-containing protein n=1 Tax=Microthlaspi erraticum TaxID=1685480 RepID=A0A6D2KQ48_9BRAS|nr:unnamed protein product [Microthlaspi erraticum]